MTSSTNDLTPTKPSGPRHRAASPRNAHWLRELVIVVVVAVGVAVLLRVFVVQTFSIPSGSMSPPWTSATGLWSTSWPTTSTASAAATSLCSPGLPPKTAPEPPVSDLVKRVIGLPGETISLSGNGYVLINGKRLDETWLPESQQGTTYPGPSGSPYSLQRPYKIPANHYFMMGDNRGDSCDSRFWGPIPKSLIVGKVDLRIWPLSRFHFF